MLWINYSEEPIKQYKNQHSPGCGTQMFNMFIFATLKWFMKVCHVKASTSVGWWLNLPIGFLSNQPTSGKRTLLMVEHPSKNMIEDNHSNISDCNHENTQKKVRQ